MSQVTVLQCDRCRDVAKPEKAVDWRPAEVRIVNGGETSANSNSVYLRWEHLCGPCLAVLRQVLGGFNQEVKRAA